MINAYFIKFTKNGGDNKMKYRKKPIEVEAFQFNGNLKDSNDVYYVPNWAKQAFENGTLYFGHTKYNKPPYGLFIKTLDKVTHVSVGDFVIRDSHGKIYSCKPDIFANIYEKVNDKEVA